MPGYRTKNTGTVRSGPAPKLLIIRYFLTGSMTAAHLTSIIVAAILESDDISCPIFTSSQYICFFICPLLNGSC